MKKKIKESKDVKDNDVKEIQKTLDDSKDLTVNVAVKVSVWIFDEWYYMSLFKIRKDKKEFQVELAELI